MSSPLAFSRDFHALLTEHGIRHVLTSGMACVEYGIQQTTKDTDWIIGPESLPRLVDLLAGLERGLTGRNWRISYRFIFGSPLHETYLGAGWTSHIEIQESPLSSGHHVDIFGKPPRLTTEAALADAKNGVAGLLGIAQMKKTDRDKDWPILEALSFQATLHGNPAAILHLRDPELLQNLWLKLSPSLKEDFSRRRPLLRILDLPGSNLRKALAIERAFWQECNKLRQRHYQKEWQDFLRRWRSHDQFAWPVAQPFPHQHAILSAAVRDFQLPVDPLGGSPGRSAICEQASASVAEIFDVSPPLMESLRPPLGEILP